MGEIIVQSKLSAFLYINISGYASLLGNEWRTGLTLPVSTTLQVSSES